jgi:hypothetical protein
MLARSGPFSLEYAMSDYDRVALAYRDRHGTDLRDYVLNGIGLTG